MTACIATTTQHLAGQGGPHRLVCRGQMDARAVGWLRLEFAGLLDAGARSVVIDLGQADHVDVTVVTAIASGIRALRHRGAGIAIVPPVESSAGRLIRQCGLLSIAAV